MGYGESCCPGPVDRRSGSGRAGAADACIERAGRAGAAARIVLLAGEGMSNTAIARRVGESRPTVIGWRGRFLAKGVAGLLDEPRSVVRAASTARA